MTSEATTQPKIKYPASVFSQLKDYPLRHCTSKTCGKQLTPKLLDNGKLESVANFKVRRTCGGPCKGAVISQRYAERTREKKGRKTSPPVKAAQDAPEKVDGLDSGELSQTSPPEPPTLIDPAYGGPAAPEDVAEELEPEPEQVAAHVEQVAEQVEASSVDELRSSIDSESMELKPSMVAEEPSMSEPDKSEPDMPEQTLQVGESKPGELKPGEIAAGEIEEVREDPRIGRVARPVTLPGTKPLPRLPVVPPSAQARLPDPRPPAPFTVTQGEVIESADYGNCPNDGCGRPLNGFGRCSNCEQREKWLKGQGVAKVNLSRKSD